MRTAVEKESSKSRISEVLIAIVIAAASGGITSYLTIPVAMARFEEQLRAQEQRLEQHDLIMRTMTPGAATAIAALNARQDGDDRFRTELDGRLSRIEQQNAEILRELRNR